jgi:hypothetical protein
LLYPLYISVAVTLDLGHLTRGKGSEAATKCHVASESFTVKRLQKNFYDLAKTYQEIPIYGQVL